MEDRNVSSPTDFTHSSMACSSPSEMSGRDLWPYCLGAQSLLRRIGKSLGKASPEETAGQASGAKRDGEVGRDTGVATAARAQEAGMSEGRQRLHKSIRKLRYHTSSLTLILWVKGFEAAKSMTALPRGCWRQTGGLRQED